MNSKHLSYSHILLLATAALSLTSSAHSAGTVSVTLLSFSNPENKLIDGNYCNLNQTKCSMKFGFTFKQPIQTRFYSASITTNSISYTTGPSAITTYNGGKAPNPFPTDPSTDNAIGTLVFTIDVKDYSTGKMQKVASFSVNEDIKFQTQVYNLSSGFSSFVLSTNISCAADFYGNCTVYCVDGTTFTCDPVTGIKVCNPGWSGPNCLTKIVVPCLINSVTHGSYAPQVTSYKTGGTVTVSCDLGYSPPKTDLICQNDGNWSPKWPSCALAECGLLNPLPNGAVTPSTSTNTNSTYGTSVAFSCNSGYQITGHSNTTCTEDGTWGNDPPTCDEIRCPKVSLSEKETVSPVSANSSTSAIGTKAFFYCLSGYTLEGSSNIVCLDSGAWDNVEPVCKLVMCPDIRTSSPRHSSFYALRPPPRTPNNMITQRCFDQYVPKGQATRICQKNGTWDGEDTFHCLNACSKIDDFDGGKVIYTSETPAEGTTASFECDQTKFLVGTKRTVCTTEGTWDLTQVPTCTSGCKTPDMISNNVTVTPASYQTDIILTGYNLSFSCPKGCYLSSRPQISCLDNGQWDSSIPTCVNFVEDIDATIKGLYISGISIISAVFAVFVVSVILFVYIDRKLTRRMPCRKKSYIPTSTSRQNLNSIKLRQINSVSSSSTRKPNASLPSLSNNKQAQLNQNVQNNNNSGRKFAYKNPAFTQDDF